MKISYLLVLLISLFVFSCKKDEQNNFSNAEFSSSSITKDGDLKVFSESGRVVKDVNTIQNFMRDEKILMDFDKTNTNGEQIKFISADSVYFLGTGQHIYGKYAYKMQGTKILFYETLEEMLGGGDAYIENLYRTIVKYQPTYSASYNVSGIGGLHTYRKTTNTFVGYITKTELKLYRFAFKFHKVNGGNAWRTDIGIPINQFNEDFAKKLTSQDLLAIQPYVLNFNRSK